MAFNGSFSVATTSDPKTFVLTDNSTGADSNITGRTISLYKSDGTLLSGSTISWPKVALIGDTITLSLLTIDYSLRIQVNWVSSSPLPSPSTYTLSALNTFTGNLKAFWYQLIQRMAANPGNATQRAFLKSLGSFVTYLDNAGLATAEDDQTNAQLALNSAYYMQQNQTTFF